MLNQATLCRATKNLGPPSLLTTAKQISVPSINPSQYVEQRGDAWYLRGSRVSVDSLIHAFHDGLSPEAIARECFSTLSLEQVYGAITFYLANRAFAAFISDRSSPGVIIVPQDIPIGQAVQEI